MAKQNLLTCLLPYGYTGPVASGMELLAKEVKDQKLLHLLQQEY